MACIISAREILLISAIGACTPRPKKRDHLNNVCHRNIGWRACVSAYGSAEMANAGAALTRRPVGFMNTEFGNNLLCDLAPYHHKNRKKLASLKIMLAANILPSHVYLR